jgi:predicted glycoside hydrolase/deacetylase ChbG (UPF0249 family)
MRKVLLLFLFAINGLLAQNQSEIRLIVRSDDMGFCHSVNTACIEAFKNGISRTVEIMAPTPWFPEAVKLLQANPTYDVGIHLVLTSEWENLKWRPLTTAPSLVDADGFFLPFIWENKNAPQTAYLTQRKINLQEVEAELRAQIELVKRHLPQVSHLSGHMGCNHTNPEIKSLVDRLAIEYQLPIEIKTPFTYVKDFSGNQKSPQQKEKDLIKILENLKPGTHYIVEHPGYLQGDMETVGHKGYENVAYDRQGITQAFTSPAVKKVIAKRKIRLMSVKELIQMNQ